MRVEIGTWQLGGVRHAAGRRGAAGAAGAAAVDSGERRLLRAGAQRHKKRRCAGYAGEGRNTHGQLRSALTGWTWATVERSTSWVVDERPAAALSLVVA